MAYKKELWEEAKKKCRLHAEEIQISEKQKKLGRNCRLTEPPETAEYLTPAAYPGSDKPDFGSFIDCNRYVFSGKIKYSGDLIYYMVK